MSRAPGTKRRGAAYAAKPKTTRAQARPKARARGGPSLYARRAGLRIAALVLGVVVLLAHVFTLKPIAAWLDWLHIDWPDMAKHFTMLALFTLAYRMSWSGGSAHEKGLASAVEPTWACIALCSGWGCLCESLQHWIPARDFNVFELAVNVGAPAGVALVYAAVQKQLVDIAHKHAR